MVVADDGEILILENLPLTITPGANGPTAISVESPPGSGIIYTQTITRDGSGTVTAVSRFVKQV